MPGPKPTSPRSFLLLAGVLGASLLVSPLAHAGPGQGQGKKRGPGKKLDKMCQKLECSGTQKTELGAAFKELRTDIKPEREAMRELAEKLGREYAKKDPNEKTMKDLYRRLDAHRANVRERTHETFMEVHPILRPEQRRLLAQMLSKKR